MASKVVENNAHQQDSNKTRERKYELDLLRICAIIAVIIVHCVSFSTAVDRQASHHLSWFGAITIDSFVRWCVPVFVMISGALAINKKAFTSSGAFLKKRFLRLLPAIIAWPFIYEVWAAILQHRAVDFVALFKGYILGSPVAGGQLYFLFLIAGLYLLTPFISAYVSLVTRRQLWVATIAILTATTAWYTLATLVWRYEPSLNLVTQGLPYVGYFMLGYLLKDVIVKHWYIPVSAFVLGSTTICMAVVLTQHTFLYNFFFSYPTIFVMIVSPAAFLSGKLLYGKLATLIPLSRKDAFQKILVQLSGAAFGVYLIHLIILDIFTKTLNLDRSSLKTSLMLIPLVTITSWTIVFIVVRIPYMRNLVR